MASEDDNISSTGIAPDVPAEAAAPIKKAAAKRAPRKATKKASAPQLTPDGVSSATTEATAEVSSATAEVNAAPARKTAKRAPRKSTKKSVAAPFDLESAQGAPAQIDSAPLDHAPEPEAVKAPAVETFGLFFQPPAPTEAPRRRRATAPAAGRTARRSRPQGPSQPRAPVHD